MPMLNPFRSWIAGDAWELPEADVGEIGRQAFNACCRAIAATLAEQRTTAVLVRGAPGSGKTHLMRRLRAHLAQSPDERLRETLFVYIRLSTTPNMIWRHLRRRIADDLMRPAADGTMQLESLLYRVLASPGSRGGLLDRCKHEWAAGLQWTERAFAHALGVMLRRVPESVLATLDIFDKLEGESMLSPGLVKALRRLVHRQDLVLVRAWLRGDSLTAADLDKLGIAEDAAEDEDREYAAREMVLMLARLAGSRMPIVLCFDQVEALETNPGDKAGFLAFGGAAGTLHDETKNLVLISCMQSSMDPMFRRADLDRIAEHQASLPLLGRGDAMRLVKARLEAAGPGVVWDAPAEFASVFDEAALASARQILAKAAELFDRGFSAPAGPPLSLNAFLQQEWDRRVDGAVEAISQGDIDEVLDQGIQALIGATAPGQWKAARGAGDTDFRLESSTARIDVSLCNQRNMNSLAARLRRLGGSARSGRTRLVLLRDPRLPIGKNARATRGYLDDLSRAGARVVHPSLEALEALEALRTLLADARSGDLTRDGSPIGPETVQDWIARNLPTCLVDLVEDITGGEPASPVNTQLREDLRSLVEERCLITLDEAAREIRQEASLVRQAVLASPDLAGLLEGPPTLLYRQVPAVRA
jgi:hypothetical protein